MTPKYTLSCFGLTVGLAVAAAAPALAAPTPEPISAQVTKATSASRQTTSEVTVAGTWQTPRLTVGSTLTVGSVDGGFAWRAGFPFTLDDGTRIGECVADQATLTCTVTEVPEAWAAKEDVTGTFHARAQLTDKAVGTESTQITLNGETVRTLAWGDKDGTGACSSDCSGPAHYEYARPETVKFGWTDANGAIAWGIQWRIDPGAEYTITDETNALHAAVKCSTGPTWAPDTTSWTDGKLDDTKHTLTFTPPGGRSRVRDLPGCDAARRGPDHLHEQGDDQRRVFGGNRDDQGIGWHGRRRHREAHPRPGPVAVYGADSRADPHHPGPEAYAHHADGGQDPGTQGHHLPRPGPLACDPEARTEGHRSARPRAYGAPRQDRRNPRRHRRFPRGPSDRRGARPRRAHHRPPIHQVTPLPGGAARLSSGPTP